MDTRRHRSDRRQHVDCHCRRVEDLGSRWTDPARRRRSWIRPTARFEYRRELSARERRRARRDRRQRERGWNDGLERPWWFHLAAERHRRRAHAHFWRDHCRCALVPRWSWRRHQNSGQQRGADWPERNWQRRSDFRRRNHRRRQHSHRWRSCRERTDSNIARNRGRRRGAHHRGRDPRWPGRIDRRVVGWLDDVPCRCQRGRRRQWPGWLHRGFRQGDPRQRRLGRRFWPRRRRRTPLGPTVLHGRASGDSQPAHRNR